MPKAHFSIIFFVCMSPVLGLVDQGQSCKRELESVSVSNAQGSRSMLQLQKTKECDVCQHGQNFSSSVECRVCAYKNINILAKPANSTQAGTPTRQESSSGSWALQDNFLVLTIGDAARFSRFGDYGVNNAAWACYGNRWGVPIRAIDPRDVPGCPQGLTGFDWFFARLCVTATVLESFLSSGENERSLGEIELGLTRKPKWIFHIDGDTVVFNADISLPNLVKTWHDRDIILYERFRSGEVVAGNYVVQVTDKSAAFLRGWEGMRPVAKNCSGFSNGDNGALHLHLISFLQAHGDILDETASLTSLTKLYQQSHDIPSYDRFVAAAKLALGRKRIFKHVLLQRRGHGFCIDDDLYGGSNVNMIAASGGIAAHFFCIHGEKTTAQLIESVGEACIESVERCSNDLLKCPKAARDSDVSLSAAVHREASLSRMSLGGINDIAECWPDCPADIPEEIWKHLQAGLQKNAQCENVGAPDVWTGRRWC